MIFNNLTFFNRIQLKINVKKFFLFVFNNYFCTVKTTENTFFNMEQKFDINRVIERYNLNQEDVAKVLFPHAKYYKFAFDRVLKGEASLNTEQLEALAKLAGVMIHDLFTFENWKGSSEDGCVVLLKGDYKVKLNYKGVYVSLYKGTNLIHQELSLKSMSMDEFIEYINQIINKQNQQDETN